ncbi:DUF262 domain-containing protein [Ruminococcus sp. HUN007]|jgi:uncharacterized protein with ParB-like and HNH nuclease domain|uniref:DUF262 domain-containing protein n=1 Tax=Ruminococcus sp. HUN007 TaxID=1514668 RepID=UPI0005D27EC7|nr:DUF262 domain-containing protein [Ruminococcus sp. HUN007]
MSKLNIDQKIIKDLFSDKKSDFLIPDYQRPYAWGEKECQTLWDDIFAFAFPEDDCDKFDSDNDEYFLGPVVTFKNEEGKMEIIDGQQRLTTLMLLLRAFYAKFGNMQSDKAIKTAKIISQCLWKTDEFGEPDKAKLKINSEVATDNDKQEFLDILRTGTVSDNNKSVYAKNYRFFQKQISDFINGYPDFFSFLPIRILNNCVLLPIEAESQDTALRIFSTLNDRGKPLSDADIFKAQFYKYYSSLGKKDEFIKRWKDLEVLCNDIYHPISGTPMDEAFTRYMYYERAKAGVKSSTTEALRKFYERNNYALLKKEETFENLIDLANFWNDVAKQDDQRFSDRILRRLFVLNYAPNGMWTYIVSVYYLVNRDQNGILEDEKFYAFLNRITAFIWAYAVVNPGVNALRTPVYAEMIKIINNETVDFSDYCFETANTRNKFDNYAFGNTRAITKSMLVWWAFNDNAQQLIDINTVYEIEHIYARKRNENEPLKDSNNIESLGNKAILEKRINIRASDYKFSDKKKYYVGFVNSKGQQKEASKVHELVVLGNKADYDFTESEIVSRYNLIMDTFMEYLKSNDLLK